METIKKNQHNQETKEEFEKHDPLKTDQNKKENREDLEKINNGLEIDEIDHPKIDEQ